MSSWKLPLFAFACLYVLVPYTYCIYIHVCAVCMYSLSIQCVMCVSTFIKPCSVYT